MLKSIEKKTEIKTEPHLNISGKKEHKKTRGLKNKERRELKKHKKKGS